MEIHGKERGQEVEGSKVGGEKEGGFRHSRSVDNNNEYPKEGLQNRGGEGMELR